MRYLDDIDFSGMTDEEIDEYYRPQKTNSRKSMAPLFVYLVLKANTDWEKHYTQNEILKKLEEDFEIRIERKALSRILHQLSDSDVDIVTSPRNGCWFDQRLDCA